ncbi:unnamed protein product, partial [Ectocarpus sp. 13 AM-2016]
MRSHMISGNRAKRVTTMKSLRCLPSLIEMHHKKLKPKLRKGVTSSPLAEVDRIFKKEGAGTTTDRLLLAG